MDAKFWLGLWKSNRIPFHEGGRSMRSWSGIFQPWTCRRDVRSSCRFVAKAATSPGFWHRGHPVVGVELSALAIEQLFAELGVTPKITQTGDFVSYEAANIRVLVGDVFALTAEMLGPVAAIYDRAALIALPPEVRRHYSAHLVALTRAAPQLLITITYDQSLREGPPFSVSDAEVANLYAARYQIRALERRDVAAGDGRFARQEVAWELSPVRG